MTPDQIEVLNSENQAETVGAASARIDALTLKVAIGDYDRIRPLIDVSVVPGTGPGQLLIDGESDAVVSPEPPPEFAAGDPRIRRLFADARAEQAGYFKKTGIYPITHLVVIHENMTRQNPWAAERLVVAFREAQRLTDAYYNETPKRLSLPGAAFIVGQERRDYGPEPWSHGLAGNEANLETFVRYAKQQRYIDEIIPVDKFFAPNTLDA